ncbi:DUF559 domain-containing protein [Nostoc sp.]|uniref:DUF559 domain-containing protein n=1 Tax=Nostoc sp. TaxID=1180 RepID=UPI002FF8B1AC
MPQTAIVTKNKNISISNNTQQSARFQTTKMLRVLKFLLPDEGWDKNKLHKEAGGKTYTFQHVTIRGLGQPNGSGTEYLWEITVDEQWARQLFEANNKADAELVVKAEVYPKIWNGIVLRSPAEVAIAEALQQQGVLFFANARCRLCNRLGQLETSETDFLIVRKGVLRILEVDGKTFHPDASIDYKRDRTFAKEGIQTSRFTASECLKNPGEVVKEFLELFDSCNHGCA